jgi:hypothetical protein
MMHGLLGCIESLVMYYFESCGFVWIVCSGWIAITGSEVICISL